MRVLWTDGQIDLWFSDVTGRPDRLTCGFGGSPDNNIWFCVFLVRSTSCLTATQVGLLRQGHHLLTFERRVFFVDVDFAVSEPQFDQQRVVSIFLQFLLF